MTLIEEALSTLTHFSAHPHLQTTQLPFVVWRIVGLGVGRWCMDMAWFYPRTGCPRLILEWGWIFVRLAVIGHAVWGRTRQLINHLYDQSFWLLDDRLDFNCGWKNYIWQWAFVMHLKSEVQWLSLYSSVSYTAVTAAIQKFQITLISFSRDKQSFPHGAFGHRTTVSWERQKEAHRRELDWEDVELLQWSFC